MNPRRFALAASTLLVIAFAAIAARSEIAARNAGNWVDVKKDDLLLGVSVEGELESIESSSLGPPQVPDRWDFKISMLAPEGSEAKSGQPVLSFDTSELEREREEKLAERDAAQKEIERTTSDLALKRREETLRLKEAEANLRKAELKLEAPPDLLGRNERREIEIERDTLEREVTFRRKRLQDIGASASETLSLSRAKLETAQRRLAQIDSSIEKMTVRAPRAGTVVYATNWRSEKKKVGDSAWVGEKIVEIPDLTKLRAKGEIDESDAGRISLGQRVSLRLDAHPETEFRGRITAIGQSVQKQKVAGSPLKVLAVRIALDKVDPAVMRPGMHFRGTVETSRVAGSTVVPADTLISSDGELAVVKRSMLGMKVTRVAVGKRNESMAQVVAGVQPGDRVLQPKEGTEARE